MTIQPISRAGLEQEQGRLRGLFAQPEQRNAGTVLLLDVEGDGMAVPFRGRVYALPSVPYQDGVRLLELKAELDGFAGRVLEGPELERYRAAWQRVAELVYRLVLPRDGPVRRFLWRLRLWPNPFKSATERELAELLGFLSACRMRSSVRQADRPASTPTR